MASTNITVAYGDGIGPEIMEAVLLILKEAKAQIGIETIELGEDLYRQGYTSGISPQAWDAIHRNKILLKAPITTPQGSGYKSLNVTIRKSLGLYANIRPCKAFHPYVHTHHPETDVVIVRENEEDLYAGIEYRLSRNTREAIKLITRSGSENIVRYAFEYAVQNNRKTVTCMTKDNIMKFADGLFHQVFDEIGAEYPQITKEHYIVDIGAAKLATDPKRFDVIVTQNLYGDIISDIVAEVAGSVGMAGSANIGNDYAMFEAIHGSAPRLAGQNVANPSGLLHGAIMMLVHINQPDVATLIHNAWLKTLEDGVHTYDVYNENTSTQKVGTKEFAEAVAQRLGQKPQILKAVHYNDAPEHFKVKAAKEQKAEHKQLVGVDIFIDFKCEDPNIVANKVNGFADRELRLQFISSKGLKIWPKIATSSFVGLPGEFWRLRFAPNNQEKITSHDEILYLLQKFRDHNIDFIQTINLYTYDGQLGFALAQGE